MNIKYQTERLIIREWEDSDYMDLYEYASDPVVTKYLHFATYQDTDTAVTRINYLKEKYHEDPLTGEFAIMLKGENKVIGAINLSRDTFKAGGIIALGWVLNKKYHGYGYMTECVKETFRYIKRNNLAKRIRATHDSENIKSGHVMQRAGMKFEGISRKAGENNFHSRYDVVNYSILDEEIEL